MADQAARKYTTLLAILFGFVVLIVGGLLLWVSAYCESNGMPIRSSVSREFGAFWMIGATLHLWWEVTGKRKYTDELFEKMGMARELSTAGIEKITTSFKDDSIAWQEYFERSTRLDLWFSYANTWTSQQADKLRALAAKEGTKIRLALPDPDDGDLMSQLANRYELTPAEVQQKVRLAITEFRGLTTEAAKVEIYLCRRMPVFTFYIFSSVCVLALYTHRRAKLPVPTFVCSNKGTISLYLANEFNELVTGGRLAE